MIYEVVEDIRMALEGLLRPEEVERIVGTAEVRQLFRIPKVGTVAGCYVSDGVMQRNLPVHLVRDQVRIFSGRIDSLKRFKDDAREVREGYECGISIEGYNDIKEGDLIECYRIDEVARTLAESAAASGPMGLETPIDSLSAYSATSSGTRCESTDRDRRRV